LQRLAKKPGVAFFQKAIEKAFWKSSLFAQQSIDNATQVANGEETYYNETKYDKRIFSHDFLLQ